MPEWVDIEGIGDVAHAEKSGHARTSAQDIQEVLNLVGHRRGHQRKGSVPAIKHCAKMRFRKTKNRKNKLAPHVSERIRKHNADSFRHKELIDVDEQRPEKVMGEREIQTNLAWWTPQALFQHAWRDTSPSCEIEIEDKRWMPAKSDVFSCSVGRGSGRNGPHACSTCPQCHERCHHQGAEGILNGEGC